MKFHNSNVLLATFIITVLVIGIYTTANYLFPTIDDDSSALTYGSNTDISFTINPKLSIATSANSLTIDNLVPGTTSNSNKVSVTVSSNTQYGYVLSAGVGSTVSTDPYYNTSDLVHENSTISNVFSSVDTSASLETLDTDNTWGYSTSTDGGTSWSAYSGLSNTTTKPLLDVSNPAAPSTIDFKIAARSASTQASGTYNNVITFYAVGKPKPLTIYEEVAKMSKGTQDATDLKTDITSPTSKDYREDTSNSGVYEYNSSVFGESSDASNANKIYYYRGILDGSFAVNGNIGSSGDGAFFQNYVILDADGIKDANDTCWRIVRTTGSGGVKMIYNGKWTGNTSTGYNCANAHNSASIDNGTLREYNGDRYGDSYSDHRIALVGYTYNPAYVNSDISSLVSIGSVFGDESNYSDNTANSRMKTSIEKWYDDTILGYADILESSAGYCNDRSAYSDAAASIVLDNIAPIAYSYSNTQMYFGAYGRNIKSSKSPTLSCPRGKVDIYSMNSSAIGNGQLSRPIALLTADEASFAGSGTDSTSGAAYNIKSYLCSGYPFWLLSPSGRNSDGKAGQTNLNAQGRVSSHYSLKHGFQVRPAISLKPGVMPISGSGTAADPWVVTAP